MTKQEEIRKGMLTIIEFCGNEPDICVGELEMYLDKMGVVIKKYQPVVPSDLWFVEALIEGVKNG